MSKYHVLDFLLDDEDSCAATFYSEDNHRVHVIADAENLKKSKKSAARNAWSKYERLVDACRGKQSEPGDQASSPPDSAIGLSTSETKELAQRATNVEDAEEALQAWMLEPIRSQHPLGFETSPSIEQTSLLDWYDAETHFFNLDITDAGELKATGLEAASDLKRRIAKLKPEISLPKYIRDIGLPWYEASDLIVLAGSEAPPPYHPTQVKVRESGETLFFKAVQGDTPASTKRELSLLHRLVKPDLRDKIRVPRLRGLVTLGHTHTKAVGFLQSEIMNPVPLTTKLDSEVPQEDRDRWADEAERMMKVLHEHNIVWGDAKADNLLVDEDGNLWLIDMGGSYTEGWVDPEIKETEEGDDQGTEKIVNALHDPVANTMDPTDEHGNNTSSDSRPRGVKRSASEVSTDQEDEPFKRSKVEQERRPSALVPFTEVEDKDEPEESEQRSEENAHHDGEPAIEGREEQEVEEDTDISQQQQGTGESLYCYCNRPGAGRMVGCDGPGCKKAWFHFECAGLDNSPEGDWYCDECK